jgi:hypothetical protein
VDRHKNGAVNMKAREKRSLSTIVFWIVLMVGALAVCIGAYSVKRAAHDATASPPKTEAARKLREEIALTYKTATHLLPANAEKLFTDMMQKFIPKGTSFEEGEKRLMDAGFSINTNPYQSSNRERGIRKHETWARLHLASAPLALASSSLSVRLIPAEPERFDRIGIVRAQLITLTP